MQPQSLLYGCGIFFLNLISTNGKNDESMWMLAGARVHQCQKGYAVGNSIIHNMRIALKNIYCQSFGKQIAWIINKLSWIFLIFLRLKTNVNQDTVWFFLPNFLSSGMTFYYDFVTFDFFFKFGFVIISGFVNFQIVATNFTRKIPEKIPTKW